MIFQLQPEQKVNLSQISLLSHVQTYVLPPCALTLTILVTIHQTCINILYYLLTPRVNPRHY